MLVTSNFHKFIQAVQSNPGELTVLETDDILSSPFRADCFYIVDKGGLTLAYTVAN